MKGLPCITDPWVYYGLRYTQFGAHIEDANSCSVNVNISKYFKIWYFIRPLDEALFIELMKSE